MKTFLFLILFLMVGGGFLIIGIGFFSQIEDDQQAKIDSLIHQSYTKISEGEYDEALSFAKKADSLNKFSEGKTSNILVKELPRFASKRYQDSLLFVLEESDIREMKEKKLFKVLFADDTLNRKISEILFARIEERPAIIKSYKEREKAEKIEKKERARRIRIASEKILRNQFLDSSLDIKVTVKGKNKDHLYLEYILFSDVWFRKFETEGLFNQYHDLGFNKVTLSDGYNYNKYVYW